MVQRYNFGTILRDDSPSAEKQEQTFAVVYAPTAHPEIPARFDGRDAWAAYLSPIKNQGLCGACYAFSVVGMLADRYAIQTLGQVRPDLTPLDFALCMKTIETPAEFLRSREDPVFEKTVVEKQALAACQGNTMYNAARAVYVQGVFEEPCVPDGTIKGFVSKHGKLPTCTELEGAQVPSVCTNGDPPRYWMAEQYYTIGGGEVNESTVREIKLEIMKWGPVAAGFHVFDDFLSGYKDGTKVYTHPKKEQKPLGGHAIRIVGWGEELVDGRDVKYWIIANSWGVEWGDRGYGKIEIMIPEIQLEKNVVSVWPQILGSDFPYPMVNNALVPKVSADDKAIKAQLPIDPATMYRNEHLLLIKQGKMNGSIKPVIDTLKIPFYENFWAFRAGAQKFQLRNGDHVYSLLEHAAPGSYAWAVVTVLVVAALVAAYIFANK
jgi:cathepsin B